MYKLPRYRQHERRISEGEQMHKCQVLQEYLARAQNPLAEQCISVSMYPLSRYPRHERRISKREQMHKCQVLPGYLARAQSPLPETMHKCQFAQVPRHERRFFKGGQMHKCQVLLELRVSTCFAGTNGRGRASCARQQSRPKEL